MCICVINTVSYLQRKQRTNIREAGRSLTKKRWDKGTIEGRNAKRKSSVCDETFHFCKFQWADESYVPE